MLTRPLRYHNPISDDTILLPGWAVLHRRGLYHSGHGHLRSVVSFRDGEGHPGQSGPSGGVPVGGWYFGEFVGLIEKGLVQARMGPMEWNLSLGNPPEKIGWEPAAVDCRHASLFQLARGVVHVFRAEIDLVASLHI